MLNKLVKSVKGQAAIMGTMAVAIAGILAVVIVNAFIDAGNFTGTISTLADTVPLILIGIIVFTGVAAFGLR